MPNAKKRHIFAPTYGDENRLGVYVLLEVYPNTVDIALAAQKHSIAFDSDPVTEGYFSDTLVTTPELGGEYVFTGAPRELEGWIFDREDLAAVGCPRLLPVELDSMLEEIKEAHRADGDIRWDCRPARFVADKDDIRLMAADKHEQDHFVWTSDLWPLLFALQVDFDVNGFAINPEVSRG